jgi:hypothetical protein
MLRTLVYLRNAAALADVETALAVETLLAVESIKCSGPVAAPPVPDLDPLKGCGARAFRGRRSRRRVRAGRAMRRSGGA